MPNNGKSLPRRNNQNQRQRAKRQNRPTKDIIDRSSVLLTQPIVDVSQTVFKPATTKIVLSVNGLANSGAARLAAFLQLYDEFKFTRLRIRWEPALPSTTTGQVAVYYDPDPSAEVPATFEAISGNEYMRVGHIARTRVLNVPRRALNARLNWFTRKDPGTAGTQGNVVLVTSGGTVPHATGKVALGSLWLDYEVHVRAPTSVAPATRADALPPVMLAQQQYDNQVQMSRNVSMMRDDLDIMRQGMNTYNGTTTFRALLYNRQAGPPTERDVFAELDEVRCSLEQLKQILHPPEVAMDYSSTPELPLLDLE